MYLLVNASPPKLLYISSSNLAEAFKGLDNIKGVFAMVYHILKS